MNVAWLTTGLLGAALLFLVLRIYARFRRDLRAAHARLRDGGSKVVETACGQMEYVDLGEGFPVLVVHGIFGGFDQGLTLVRGKLEEGLRAIVPSRFGYLRTPLPEGASPATQADAFCALLDALRIERAAVMAASAGGTSALQFALRHPDRCAALVLISSNAPGETEAGLPPRPAAQALFRSDFIFWLLTTCFPSSMQAMMGVPKGFELKPQDQAEVSEAMEILLPVKPRADGALLDMYVSNPDINRGYPLHEIDLPALIIHAKDDPLASYANAAAMAEWMPGAKLVTLESGGHMLLGNAGRVSREIAAFLRRHAEAEIGRPALVRAAAPALRSS